MHPVLFAVSIADRLLVVRAYSFFLVVGAVAALAVAFALAARAGMPKRRVAAVLLVAAIATLVGARLLNAALNWQYYADAPGRLFDPVFSGLSLYGGLLLACAAGMVAALGMRLPVWALLDITAPAVAVGLVLTRIGCFLNGCCFGKPTDLAWGVSYPRGSPAWAYDAAYGSLNLFGGSSPVHPTQLFEIGGVVVAIAIALWVGGGRRGSRAPGTTFLVFAALLSLVRLAEYFLRAPVFATQAPAWFYPALYGLLIAACAGVAACRAARVQGETCG